MLNSSSSITPRTGVPAPLTGGVAPGTATPAPTTAPANTAPATRDARQGTTTTAAGPAEVELAGVAVPRRLDDQAVVRHVLRHFENYAGGDGRIGRADLERFRDHDPAIRIMLENFAALENAQADGNGLSRGDLQSLETALRRDPQTGRAATIEQAAAEMASRHGRVPELPAIGGSLVAFQDQDDFRASLGPAGALAGRIAGLPANSPLRSELEGLREEAQAVGEMPEWHFENRAGARERIADAVATDDPREVRRITGEVRALRDVNAEVRPAAETRPAPPPARAALEPALRTAEAGRERAQKVLDGRIRLTGPDATQQLNRASLQVSTLQQLEVDARRLQASPQATGADGARLAAIIDEASQGGVGSARLGELTREARALLQGAAG